jgi:hypothetical protein
MGVLKSAAFNKHFESAENVAKGSHRKIEI